MATIHFIASVSDENINNTKAIAQQLKDKGCVINEVFEAIGTISGSVDDKTDINDLKLPGIDAVELQRKIKKFKK